MEKKTYTKPIVEITEFNMLEEIMSEGGIDGPITGSNGVEEW